jgi:predicted amidohydrolase
MGEEVLVAEIDLEKTKEARTYWLSRRKPMLYNALCSPTFGV